MLDCFQYDAYSYDEACTRWTLEATVVRKEAGGTEIELIGSRHTRCFRMNKLEIADRLDTAQSPVFYSALVLSGRGKLCWANEELIINQSEQLFIPASSPPLVWVNTDPKSELHILRCFPPSE